MPMSPLSDARRPEWLNDAVGRANGRGRTVAVIDSGWSSALADPRVLDSVAIVRNRSDLNPHDDKTGHGTMCAELVLRVASEALILPIRVFHERCETSAPIVAEAVELATSRKVDVISLSLGTRDDRDRGVLFRAIARAVDSGLVVVSSVHDRWRWSYPAVFEPVIGVASGYFPSPFDFSYTHDSHVECLAAARLQWAMDRSGCYHRASGSSLAAPLIAGISAILLQRHGYSGLGDLRNQLTDLANRSRSARLKECFARSLTSTKEVPRKE